jgi:RNA polymerase sigma-70 factor (ECF subfamily)
MFERDRPPTFERVALPHLGAAFNLARWLVRNEQDAEDAVQEAYLRAFRGFQGFRGGDARKWILTIARNTCYSLLRAKQPMRDAEALDEDLGVVDLRAPDPEEALLRNDRGAAVQKAFGKLPPAFREVLVLREQEGLSYKEIAEITGMPSGTVMSRLSRARARLGQILADLTNGEVAHAACAGVVD